MQQDWTFADAVDAGVVPDAAARAEVDLRADDWPVRDQGTTGACVGFAAADGVLHWHYRQAGLLAEGERPSPRFIWMANKETDLLTSFPTTFIESAGTQIKLALRVARRYGCVLESTLPMRGALSSLSTEAFYTKAAKVSHRQLPQPGTRPGPLAVVDLEPGAGPGAGGRGPDLGPGGRRGPVSARHLARRPRGLPGGVHADARHPPSVEDVSSKKGRQLPRLLGSVGDTDLHLVGEHSVPRVKKDDDRGFLEHLRRPSHS